MNDEICFLRPLFKCTIDGHPGVQRGIGVDVLAAGA